MSKTYLYVFLEAYAKQTGFKGVSLNELLTAFLDTIDMEENDFINIFKPEAFR